MLIDEVNKGKNNLKAIKFFWKIKADARKIRWSIYWWAGKLFSRDRKKGAQRMVKSLTENFSRYI
jgi:hypothetical protein